MERAAFSDGESIRDDEEAVGAGGQAAGGEASER